MIQIKELNKTFGKYQILKNITFEIQEGKILALLGPNGSGKSTLLKCLLGITPADLIHSWDHKHQIDLRSIGYMPQNPSFPKNLSVKEIINFLDRISLSSVSEAYKEQLLIDMDIYPFIEKNFNELSQGMKQKINILQCFMAQPNLYILDEPTAGLDPNMTYYIKKLLLEEKNKGKTILFTSHIMSEVEDLADELLVLIHGEIVLQDKPSSIIKTMKSSNLEEAIRVYWRKY